MMNKNDQNLFGDAKPCKQSYYSAKYPLEPCLSKQEEVIKVNK